MCDSEQMTLTHRHLVEGSGAVTDGLAAVSPFSQLLNNGLVPEKGAVYGLVT